MKTDESVDLVSDLMLTREVLDIHDKVKRNPLFRIRFWLALGWQRFWDWWRWGLSPSGFLGWHHQPRADHDLAILILGYLGLRQDREQDTDQFLQGCHHGFLRGAGISEETDFW